MELPHEPHIKAKNEEFWRLEGRQELDQLETLLDQLETLLDQLGTLLDQLGTLLCRKFRDPTGPVGDPS